MLKYYHFSYWMFLFTTLLPNFLPNNLQDTSCLNVFKSRVENSVDPDQLGSNAERNGSVGRELNR